MFNKKHINSILAYTLSLFALSCSSTSGFQRKESQIHIHKTLLQQNIPGLSVTVIKEGKLVFNEGFGYANLTDSMQVDPAKTLFRIASISKSMTSALMISLEKDGLLNLDSSVYHYLSDFPRKKYDFTLRQLGGHLAGIRSYRGQEFLSNETYSSVGESINIFKDDSLLFPPGSQYLYSSYGWNLMSRVCEEAAQQDYLDLMRRMVFHPNKLFSTFPNEKMPSNSGQKARRTGYYKVENDQIVEEPEVDLSNKWAGGGFESTSEDVAKFAHSFWFTDYIPDSLRLSYTEPQTLSNGESTNYGIAWVSGVDKQGRQWYGHAGGGIGAKAMMIVYPEEELVIVVLSNCSNAKLSDIYFGLADIYAN